MLLGKFKKENPNLGKGVKLLAEGTGKAVGIERMILDTDIVAIGRIIKLAGKLTLKDAIKIATKTDELVIHDVNSKARTLL